MSATTTVRVPEEVRDQLHELADETGRSMTRVLIDAVDLFRRQWLLIETNAAYARLASAEGAAEQLADEYAQLEGVLNDGLTDDVPTAAIAG